MRETVDFISAPSYQPLGQSLDALASLLRQWLADRGLGPANVVWARLFLSDPANQEAAVRGHALCSELLADGALSFIGQPMINGAKVGVMFGVDLEGSVLKSGTSDKKIVQAGATKMLLHSVRLTEDEALGLTPRHQTELIFARHIDWLREQGMTLKDNCIRTWLYVRDIDVNYAEVMRGRNMVFVQEGLTAHTHFIASTGIGGCTSNTKSVVAIDFFSVAQPELAPKYLTALEYLNPTHQYGVCFERGTALTFAGTDTAFISGTASIDKTGQCIFVGDVVRQTERLFLNISQLLADADFTLDDVTYMIVYLRDLADYQIVNEYMQSHYANVPYVITEAFVCRPQWLVEVECVAKR